MTPADYSEARIARTARDYRARLGVIEGVRQAQEARAAYPSSSLPAAFWSRVIAQLLLIERPAPEYADEPVTEPAPEVRSIDRSPEPDEPAQRSLF